MRDVARITAAGVEVRTATEREGAGQLQRVTTINGQVLLANAPVARVKDCGQKAVKVDVESPARAVLSSMTIIDIDHARPRTGTCIWAGLIRSDRSEVRSSQ